MKEKECPNCGGANPTVISEGEYRCEFCNTLFHDADLLQRKKAHEKSMMYAKTQQARFNAQAEHARATKSMGKRILLFVGLFLIIIFGFVFYMAKKSMDESNKQREEIIKSFQQAK